MTQAEKDFMELYRENDGEMEYEQDGCMACGGLFVDDEYGQRWTADFSGHMEGPDVVIDEIFDIGIEPTF